MPSVPVVGSDTKPKSSCLGRHQVQEVLAAFQEFHNPDRPAVVPKGANSLGQQGHRRRPVARAAPMDVSVRPAHQGAGLLGALVWVDRRGVCDQDEADLHPRAKGR